MGGSCCKRRGPVTGMPVGDRPGGARRRKVRSEGRRCCCSERGAQGPQCRCCCSEKRRRWYQFVRPSPSALGRPQFPTREVDWCGSRGIHYPSPQSIKSCSATWLNPRVRMSGGPSVQRFCWRSIRIRLDMASRSSELHQHEHGPEPASSGPQTSPPPRRIVPLEPMRFQVIALLCRFRPNLGLRAHFPTPPLECRQQSRPPWRTPVDPTLHKAFPAPGSARTPSRRTVPRMVLSTKSVSRGPE